MTETAEKDEVSPLKRSVNRFAHVVWIALGVTVMALFLAGTFQAVPPLWGEGEVAPRTVYAAFPLTFLEAGQQPVAVERGELLATRGQRLTAQQAQRLRAYARASATQGSAARWGGALIFSLILTGIAVAYGLRFEEDRLKKANRVALLVLTVSIVLALTRLIQGSELLMEWIPTATTALLLSMLLAQRLAMAMGLLTVFAVALAIQADLPWLVGASFGVFVGAYAAPRIRRRIHFFRAGAFTGLAQGAVLLAAHLLMATPLAGALPHALAGTASGLVSALITFCLLPLAESAFGLITDVSLLELSDLNHPLLKELSVKAPGTYHHSLLVASLAEAASAAIGANPLLARVGCTFHDVGKMLHPEYFIENQPPEGSRHEHLTPSVSTLVIQNHVKDGIELARRHRLNPTIIDFIPGHHGTGVIYYFYHRALEEVEDETKLKEERFRYPGPKPRGRETAVALLADSVEAATRAMKEKTPEQLGEVVRRVVNNKFIDGQLDECDLTLKDLHRISDTFIRVLGGIYHSRIEYPPDPQEEEQVG